MGCTLSVEDGEEDSLHDGYAHESSSTHKSNPKYPIEKGDTSEMIRIATGDRSGNGRIDGDGADCCKDAMEAAVENALSKSNAEIQQMLGRSPGEVDVKDDVIVKMIQTLISARISPDIQNDDTGMTPLMKLCSTQIRSRNAAEVIGTRLRIARVLLDRGAEVNRADDNGHTALHYLCNTRSTPCPGKQYTVIEEPLVRALVDNKADVERQSGSFGFTPLMYAVMVDNAKEDVQQRERIELLLKLGASVNTPGLPESGGVTALILAALNKKCAYGLEDEDDPIAGVKSHTDFEIIREIISHSPNIEESAVVKVGSFETQFPWLKGIEDADVVSLLKLSKEDRYRLWGKFHGQAP